MANPDPEAAVALLNDILEHAPDNPLGPIFNMRVPVIDEDGWLRNHPTIQVGSVGSGSVGIGTLAGPGGGRVVSLGALGILNGIFGADENGVGYIGMEINRDQTQVLRFSVLDEDQRRKMIWHDEEE